MYGIRSQDDDLHLRTPPLLSVSPPPPTHSNDMSSQTSRYSECHVEDVTDENQTTLSLGTFQTPSVSPGQLASVSGVSRSAVERVSLQEDSFERKVVVAKADYFLEKVIYVTVGCQRRK